MIAQSTPRKKSHLRGARGRAESRSEGVLEQALWNEPEKVLQVGNHRLETKSLLSLATSFDLTRLKKA